MSSAPFGNESSSSVPISKRKRTSSRTVTNKKRISNDTVNKKHETQSNVSIQKKKLNNTSINSTNNQNTSAEIEEGVQVLQTVIPQETVKKDLNNCSASNTNNNAVPIVHQSNSIVPSNNKPIFKFEEALHQLEAKNIPQEDDTEGSLVQAGWNVPKEYLLDHSKDKIITAAQWMYDSGSLFFYELPMYTHQVIWSHIAILLGATLEPHCHFAGDPEAHVGGVIRKPDGSIKPEGLPRGGANPMDPAGTAWPTVVIEIGYSESVTQLRNDANFWLGPNTGVQVVLLFKVWPRYANDPNKAQMLAMRFERGAANNPTYAVSFGTAHLHYTTKNVVNGFGGFQVVGFGCGDPVCNAAAMAMYQLRIPTNELFTGVAIPQNLPQHIDIDLHKIQTKVLQTLP